MSDLTLFSAQDGALRMYGSMISFSYSRYLETNKVMPKADMIRFMHETHHINKAAILLFPGGFLHIKLYF